MRVLMFAALVCLVPSLSPAAQVSVANVKPMGTSYNSYYFGRVRVNTPSYVRFQIQNTGGVPLDFHSSYISGIGFDYRHNCATRLFPGQFCEVEFRYWPPFQGTHNGRFELYFYQDAAIVIDLWGDAVPY